MNIGVFGDSFAFEMVHSSYPQDKKNNESWLNFLRKSGHKIKSYAMGGTSTWFSYKRFLRFHHHYDQIIFCYSANNRVPNMPDGLESFSNAYYGTIQNLSHSEIFHRLSAEQQKNLLAILDIQPIMIDEQLNRFISQNIFNSVNQICKQSNKPIVNILPFETIDSMDYSMRVGNVIVNLLAVSIKEMPNLFQKTSIDPRYCHLSLENNLVLSRLITNSLTFRKRNIIDSLECGDFVFDKKIANRYTQLILERENLS